MKVKNCHSVSGIVLNDPVVFGKREIWKSRMKTKPWILPPCAVVKTMWCFSFYWSDSKLKTKDSSFWFSLINSETVKAVTRAFATSINVSLETFMPSLVSLTRPSLQILGETQTGVFPISGLSFINKICHNSRISNDMDSHWTSHYSWQEKHGNTKILTMMSCRQIVTSLQISKIWSI